MELFECLYGILRKEYPIEYVLKNELLRHLLLSHPEGFIGTEYYAESYADVAMFTKEVSAVYEIKSRYDSHTRLSKQMESYSKAFSNITLVTHEGKSLRYLKHIPEYVGLVSMSADGTINEIRPPKDHVEHLRSGAVVRQLRKKELIPFATEHGFVDASIANVDELVLYLVKEMPVEELYIKVRLIISKRESIRYLKLIPELPDCLLAAMYDYRIGFRLWSSLIKMLHVPLDEYEKDGESRSSDDWDS